MVGRSAIFETNYPLPASPQNGEEVAMPRKREDKNFASLREKKCCKSVRFDSPALRRFSIDYTAFRRTMFVSFFDIC